jgi:hypothetical protein
MIAKTPAKTAASSARRCSSRRATRLQRRDRRLRRPGQGGVIDPTKVTRTALQNAASVATLLLTSDALIAEKPKRPVSDLYRSSLNHLFPTSCSTTRTERKKPHEEDLLCRRDPACGV